MDIRVWMEGLGLGQYADAFVANDFRDSGDPILRELSDVDLKNLGIQALRHRKVLLQAIAAFPAPTAARATPPDTALPPASSVAAAAPVVQPAPPASPVRARLFLSYAHVDAMALAERLEKDLAAAGYEVWRDKRAIRSGRSWEVQIEDGLRASQVVLALLSPHAVRVAGQGGGQDGVCLDEISFARFQHPGKIVPVMAQPCTPPFCIFRLDYVDLCQWRASDDRYRAGLARILAAVEDALAGRPPCYRAWDVRLQPLDCAAFLNEKRRDFTGRQWLFDELDAWRASCKERALLITGDPGAGKSAIVAQLAHLNPGGQVLAYHVCRADVLETLKPARFVRSLAAMIAENLDGYAAALEEPDVAAALDGPACEQDPLGAFELGILAPLEKLAAPAEGVRYILVDALDEAVAKAREVGPTSIVDVLSGRLERLPSWLRIVATTRKEKEILRRLAGLRARKLEATDPRNLADLRQYVEARLRSPNLAGRLAEAKATAAGATRAIQAKSAGNFLYAVEALRGIERDHYRFDNLAELPAGLGGLYDSFLRRHFNPREADFAERYAPVRRVLEVLVAAREPLARGELARAAGLEEEGRELRGALAVLAPYVPESVEGGGEGERRCKLYHKSLADWLSGGEEVAGEFYAGAGDGHRRLAEAGLAEHARGVERLSRYALSHLPAHLLAARRWEELEVVLLDLRYLEARAEAGMAFELARDMEQAARALPEDRERRELLRLLGRALARDAAFIARHPTALFQCLWNTCWWHDCAAAAHHYDPPKGGWGPEGAPWEGRGSRLSKLLEEWRAAKERRTPDFIWLRALRPPAVPVNSPLRMCLRGHEGSVTSVAFSPDGARLASGSDDWTVRLWDAATGRELDCFRGHEGSVTSVAFSPVGVRLASGSWDKSVRVWDAATGRELVCLRGHESKIFSVAFSPDGARVASGSLDGTVLLWDATSGRELACLRGHRSTVTSATFSPDGARLASASSDDTVRLWEPASGRELARLLGHGRQVTSVAFSPDGKCLASGSEDKTVCLWDAGSDRKLACLRGHGGSVTSVAISPDGAHVASGSDDQTVRLWDAVCGRELASLRGHWDEVSDVAFSPEGARLASGSYDRTVRLWDATTGRELACLRGHEEAVNSVGFSPDGTRLASGSEDKTIFWDATTGGELARICGHGDLVRGGAFSPDGARFASASSDDTVRLWEPATGSELACLRGHKSVVRWVAFTPDGARLACAYYGGTARLWDAATGKRLGVFRGTKDALAGVAESQRHPWLWRAYAVASWVIRADTKKRVAWFGEPLNRMFASPSGRAWAWRADQQIFLVALEGGRALEARIRAAMPAAGDAAGPLA